MTITAVDPDYLRVEGILLLSSDMFSDISAITIDVNADINAEIAEYVPFPFLPGLVFNHAWYLQLYNDTSVVNVRKFISAYGRFNFGVVDYAFRGQASGGEYWQYQSQRFQVQNCWSVDTESTYPAQVIVPETINPARIVSQGTGGGREAINYANTVSIRLISALSSGTNGAIVFNSFGVEQSAPVSWSDI